VPRIISVSNLSNKEVLNSVRPADALESNKRKDGVVRCWSAVVVGSVQGLHIFSLRDASKIAQKEFREVRFMAVLRQNSGRLWNQ